MSVIEYAGSNATYGSGPGPSKSLWADCDVLEVLRDPGKGTYLWEDFIQGTILTVPSAAANLVGTPWCGFGSASHTLVWGTVPEGTIVAGNAATDNLGCSVYQGTYPFMINSATGSLWFETRVAFSTAAATGMGFFVGLCDSTAKTITAPLLAAAADLADTMNVVGFHKLDANLGTFDCAYKANGVAKVVKNTGVGPLVAATYIKLGMKYENIPGNPRLYWYVNGIKQSTSQLIPASSGTDFPADAPMGVCFSQINGALATAATMTIDWVRVVQLRP